MTFTLRKNTALKFVVVGLLTAVVFFCLLEYFISKLLIRPVVASSVAYVLAVFFNYCMHYYWTFGVSQQHMRSGFRYLLMIFAGFFVNLIVMYVGIELLEINYLKMQVLSVVVIAAFNYFAASAWVFRHKATLGSKHE